MKKKISICVPVYQNKNSLDELYKRLRRVEKSLKKYAFEYIFVNDCSTDGSLENLLQIKKSNKKCVKIISFTKNFGQMAAIIAGWRFSTGDASINMAADLQDPPEMISSMVKQWEEGSEIVICFRNSHHTSLINKITSKIAYKILLPGLPSGGFDFCLLSKKALSPILKLRDKNLFYQHDILWTGYKPSFIPYDKVKRKHGKSQYNIWGRFANFLSAFISVSFMPMKIMIGFGLLFSLFSGFYILSILVNYYAGDTPFPGWSPIMVLVLVSISLNMFMFGVLGEYIWRILDEVKARPQYLVDENNSRF